MSDRKQMVLGLFMTQVGHHEGAWRHPATPTDGGIDFHYYATQAKEAEDAGFHMVFVSDTAGVRESSPDVMARVARNDSFEPLTLMAALSAVTATIGLVATVSTTFNEPYHVARKFASLDHLSGGRAAWNIVTSANAFEASNFGQDVILDHSARYERADEFMEVVTGLWDTWDDDAFPRNKESGIYADINKLHYLNHKGSAFGVRGPLNVARPPQGYPVLVQAGTSAIGIEFAAHYGEVIFTALQSLDEGRGFYRKIKDLASKFGRRRTDLVVMPGIVPIVGSTHADAVEQLEYLNALTPDEVAYEMANRLLGYVIDLRELPIDGPMPSNLSRTQLMQGRQKVLLDIAGKDGLTIRQFLRLVSVGRGHNYVLGKPEEVADQLEAMFKTDVADGFNVMPATLPDGLRAFCEQVIPILQDRGLFRTAAHRSETLRESLNLPRPVSRFNGVKIDVSA